MRLILPLVLCAAPAFAQENCGDRETIVNALADQYGESRQSIGLSSGPSVVETFANIETGSWSILITNARGLTCMVAAGDAFERLDEELKTGIRA